MLTGYYLFYMVVFLQAFLLVEYADSAKNMKNYIF